MLFAIPWATAIAAMDTGRPDQLVELLRQDCGACHGITLGGGLGPPLTRAATDGRTTAELRAAILDGRPGTAMPPWRGLLTEEDVDFLVQAIRSGRMHEQGERIGDAPAR